MEIGHAILYKVWVLKQYLKFKENWTAWMWSEKIENEKNLETEMQYYFFHNTCNGFKPLFSGNIKVTKIFYNRMTFLNSTNI